jgi:hypothetical protein
MYQIEQPLDLHLVSRRSSIGSRRNFANGAGVVRRGVLYDDQDRDRKIPIAGVIS